MQIRQGELPKAGHFRPLKIVLPLALTAFFSWQISCTTIKTDQINQIRGDSTLFQTVPIAKTETPANIKMDGAIKLVAPDVRTLEHYYIFPYTNDSVFLQMTPLRPDVVRR